MKEYHKIETLFQRDVEGIVCRPEVEMNDRCHNRVIVKIKYKDIKDMK